MSDTYIATVNDADQCVEVLAYEGERWFVFGEETESSATVLAVMWSCVSEAEPGKA